MRGARRPPRGREAGRARRSARRTPSSAPWRTPSSPRCGRRPSTARTRRCRPPRGRPPARPPAGPPVRRRRSRPLARARGRRGRRRPDTRSRRARCPRCPAPPAARAAAGCAPSVRTSACSRPPAPTTRTRAVIIKRGDEVVDRDRDERLVAGRAARAELHRHARDRLLVRRLDDVHEVVLAEHRPLRLDGHAQLLDLLVDLADPRWVALQRLHALRGEGGEHHECRHRVVPPWWVLLIGI